MDQRDESSSVEDNVVQLLDSCRVVPKKHKEFEGNVVGVKDSSFVKSVLYDCLLTNINE